MDAYSHPTLASHWFVYWMRVQTTDVSINLPYHANEDDWTTLVTRLHFKNKPKDLQTCDVLSLELLSKSRSPLPPPHGPPSPKTARQNRWHKLLGELDHSIQPPWPLTIQPIFYTTTSVYSTDWDGVMWLMVQDEHTQHTGCKEWSAV